MLLEKTKLATIKILISKALKAHSYFWDKFFATEYPLKMMENAFYFTLIALFLLKMF